MRVTEAPTIVALRSFVAALALHDTLCAMIGPTATLALKWPNDVLLNGGKVAGILLEAQTGHSGTILAIGLGVNLITHPPTTDGAVVPPVSVFSETGLHLDLPNVLTRLAAAYAARETTFRTMGFAPIRADWLAHAARLGEPIRARTGDQIRDGVFQTIDDTGNLMLTMPSGTVAIPAAEVFF
jgi:BirA family biotin operon repressor/biotin-[acetyl-CoA-carboxylase] ligase